MAPPRQVPLFDLVSKRQPAPAPGAAPRTQTKPTVRIEAASSAPSAAAPPSGPGTHPAPIHIATPRAAAVAPSRDPEPPRTSTDPGGAATLPRNQVIWIAAAGILLIILVSYIIGVSLGRRQAETKAEQELRQLQPRPVEPLGDGAASTLSGATREGARPAGPATSENRTSPAPGGVTQVRPAPAKPAPMSATRPAIRGVGQPQTDPREVDLNYLALANLSEEDTRAAIAYLGSHGLDAFAIPLETGGGAANNRGPAFRLFALPGITAEEFRQRKTSRTNLETAVTRLGEQWQKQERGPSNFSKPGWEKYTGR